jgi:hypothetical protein
LQVALLGPKRRPDNGMQLFNVNAFGFTSPKDGYFDAHSLSISCDYHDEHLLDKQLHFPSAQEN